MNILGASNSPEITEKQDADQILSDNSSQIAVVECSTFGLGCSDSKQRASIPTDVAQQLQDLFQSIAVEMAYDPGSDVCIQLQQEILAIAQKYSLVSSELNGQLLKPRCSQGIFSIPQTITSTHASEYLCNYLSFGVGSAMPVIVLPRLIPILLTPIPRLYFRWDAYDGFTTCGGIRSGTGFIAQGKQTGTALGFWGIGFSIFLPPVQSYGIIGYALHASVDADNITGWPPNYPPTITAQSPPDGAQNVPISFNAIQFSLADRNEDHLSYSVRTIPDIGSTNSANVTPGTYSMPIQGLEGTQTYQWIVQVTDGEHLVENTYSFTTEPIAPTVTNPIPQDNEQYISVNLSQLQFQLSDPQQDLMEYTVETSPDIGSGSGTQVPNGVYTISVSNLDPMTEYCWYVNVTDGENWKHQQFHFQTEPNMLFDPFTEGWQYRKKITINHTKVAGNLTNFPILISITDTDLQNNAQPDGDDILFMDNIGTANRQYHEIEYYNHTNGQLIAWVNTTHLSAKTNTTIILYYGHDHASNQQAPEMVWPSQYQAVWHLAETRDIPRTDSTHHNHHATPNNYDGDEATSGKIDGADHLDGSNDHLRTYTTYDYEYRTVTYWFKTDIIPTNIYDCILTQDDGTKLLYGTFGSSVTPAGVIHMRAGGENTEFAYPINTQTWYQIHLVRNGTKSEYYINGVLQQTGNTGTKGSTSNPNPYLVIGARRSHDRTFTGTLDEIRITNTPLTAAWITTEFQNQYAPTLFYTIGPEIPK